VKPLSAAGKMGLLYFPVLTDESGALWGVIIKGRRWGGSVVIGETSTQWYIVSTNPNWTVLGLNLGLRLIVLFIITLHYITLHYKPGQVVRVAGG
jgi:hypothetical protein